MPSTEGFGLMASKRIRPVSCRMFIALAGAGICAPGGSEIRNSLVTLELLCMHRSDSAICIVYLYLSARM